MNKNTTSVFNVSATTHSLHTTPSTHLKSRQTTSSKNLPQTTSATGKKGNGKDNEQKSKKNDKKRDMNGSGTQKSKQWMSGINGIMGVAGTMGALITAIWVFLGKMILEVIISFFRLLYGIYKKVRRRQPRASQDSSAEIQLQILDRMQINNSVITEYLSSRNPPRSYQNNAFTPENDNDSIMFIDEN
jgi:cation transport ATPase